MESREGGRLGRSLYWDASSKMTLSIRGFVGTPASTTDSSQVASCLWGFAGSVVGELVRCGDGEPGLGIAAQGMLGSVPPSQMVPWVPVHHLCFGPGPQAGLSHLPVSQMPKHRASSQLHHPNTPGVASLGVPSSGSRWLWEGTG